MAKMQLIKKLERALKKFQPFAERVHGRPEDISMPEAMKEIHKLRVSNPHIEEFKRLIPRSLPCANSNRDGGVIREGSQSREGHHRSELKSGPKMVDKNSINL